MANNTIEHQVKTFICEHWSYKLDKLKLETTLDDIGTFGIGEGLNPLKRLFRQ